MIQGYNCQAAVDAAAQIIVAADVTDESNDKQQAQPLLTQVLAHTGQVPRTASMDAGYFNEANVAAVAALGCEPLIPPDRQRHGRARPAAPRPRLPAVLAARVAAGARGVGAHLYHPQYPEALDHAPPAAPTPPRARGLRALRGSRKARRRVQR